MQIVQKSGRPDIILQNNGTDKIVVRGYDASRGVISVDTNPNLDITQIVEDAIAQDNILDDEKLSFKSQKW